VQLINALNGHASLADIYDRKLTDIFAVEVTLRKRLRTTTGELTGAEKAADRSPADERRDRLRNFYLKGRLL